MVLLDLSAGNIGIDLIILGIVIWVLGILLPAIKIPAGELKTLGQYVLIVGVVIFVVLLIL